RDARKESRVSSNKVTSTVEVGEPETAQIYAPDEVQTSTPPSRISTRARSSRRASVAVVGGRTAGALSRRLLLGGGTSIAGVVAQRLYPDIIEHLSTQLQQG